MTRAILISALALLAAAAGSPVYGQAQPEDQGQSQSQTQTQSQPQAESTKPSESAKPADQMQPPAKKKLTFFDPEDGKLDMSDFLLNHKGALPVPTIITEPAVGYGFGLGLLFFSESMADAAAEARASGKGPAPPT
ncbi:MAG TPA: glyceraldehyde-3-phosphate dehydrogenase, partial [Cupriavidus sp.]|nr:glyceraldehyde-3-phosphate dehydrogenase [Cupriavidus sp.]